MGEYIVDNVKVEVMKVFFLCELLKLDLVFIGLNIIFENLNVVVVYFGKFGNLDVGGFLIDEY